ncbi:MAG: glycosyltransferase family 4 protein [Candidatus Handelsmanbacteria bacterium]|nr:glycosyltransferase family 4 protein [Candidatus Handelsmanbacteria bacterium]
MRILFLARRYPPCMGGIEIHSYQLCERLRRQTPVRLVALRRQSLLHLAWFLPWCLWVGFWAVLLRRVEVVYFADGVAGALAPLLRPFARARFAVTIYGLELTYKNAVARWLMGAGYRACDQVAVISEQTRALTLQATLPPAQLTLIYPGIEPLVLGKERCGQLRAAFEQQHGLCFGRDRVLLSFGRQVPRKGLAAFLKEGMPLLEPDIKLLIGGRGPELERLQRLREERGLQDRVFILGPVEEEVLAMLRQSADLFLMPNIHLPDNMEGFGIAPLECMYTGLPVVAFAVDALEESLRQGARLVSPGDYPAFAAQIHHYYKLSAQERDQWRLDCRQYARSAYSWDRMAAQYLALFRAGN